MCFKNNCNVLSMKGAFSGYECKLHPVVSLSTQWWILGEANEAVASAPFFWVPLENSTYSFISLQMFIRDRYEVVTKSGKYKIDSR